MKDDDNDDDDDDDDDDSRCLGVSSPLSPVIKRSQFQIRWKIKNKKMAEIKKLLPSDLKITLIQLQL